MSGKKWGFERQRDKKQKRHMQKKDTRCFGVKIDKGQMYLVGLAEEVGLKPNYERSLRRGKEET